MDPMQMMMGGTEQTTNDPMQAMMSAETTPAETAAKPAEEKKEVKTKPARQKETKVADIKYQLEGLGEEKEEIKIESKEVKKLYDQAGDYNKKIQKMVNDITEEEKVVDKKLSELDKKIDPFSIETNSLLGNVQQIYEEIDEYLIKKGALSEELEKLKIDLDSFKEKVDELRSKVTAIATLKKALYDFVGIISNQIIQASKDEIEAGQNQRNISKKETTEQTAQNFLNKIIEIFGKIDESTDDVKKLKKQFDEKVKEIENEVSAVESDRTKFLEQAKTMDQKIEDIGKAEAKKAKQAEIELGKKMDQRVKEQQKILSEEEALKKLAIHEKFMVYLARILIGIRDSIKRLIGKQTKIMSAQAGLKETGKLIKEMEADMKTLENRQKLTEKIRNKLKEMAEEREKLIKQIKGDEPKEKKEKAKIGVQHETIGEATKRLATATLRVIANGFTKFGGWMNEKLEKMARVTPVEPAKKKAKLEGKKAEEAEPVTEETPKIQETPEIPTEVSTRTETDPMTAMAAQAQAQPEQAQPEQAQPEQAQPEQAQPEQAQPETVAPAGEAETIPEELKEIMEQP